MSGVQSLDLGRTFSYRLRMTKPHMRLERALPAAVLFVSAVVSSCGPSARPPGTVQPTRGVTHTVVPAPASIAMNGGEPFRLDSNTAIVATSVAEVMRTAEMLAARLRPATGYPIPVVPDAARAGAIILRLNTSATGEAYELRVTRDSVRISGTAAGIFRGMQTLRQMMPPGIESDMRIN